MKMKTKTIALIGGGAVIAYLLYSKSKTTTVKTVNPNLALSNGQAAQNAALITASTSLFNTAVNAIQNADNTTQPAPLTYHYSPIPDYTNTPTPDSSSNYATDDYSQDNGGSTYDSTMSGMRRKGINRKHIV
jgi:hypothetical protein